MGKLAEARAKIEARAKERFGREQAEHEAKLTAREAKTDATGKKPGGRPISLRRTIRRVTSRCRPTDEQNVFHQGAVSPAGLRAARM